MPSPNAKRIFHADGYYHLYNRGVEKRPIFYNGRDYQTFLFYLNVYLSSPEQLAIQCPRLRANLVKHNLHGRIDMHGYCLMPNHFHLLIHQRDARAYSQLMKQLTNAYTQYFNQEYHRVGSLFQGPFKARLVENEKSLINLADYIHQNPVRAQLVHEPSAYGWSSWQEYHGTQFLCATELLLSASINIDARQSIDANTPCQISSPRFISHTAA